MFTDGYTWDSWGDDDYCDTIFVIPVTEIKIYKHLFGVTVSL